MKVMREVDEEGVKTKAKKILRRCVYTKQG